MNSVGRHNRDSTDPAQPSCDYDHQGTRCAFFTSGHEFVSLPYPHHNSTPDGDPCSWELPVQPRADQCPDQPHLTMGHLRADPVLMSRATAVLASATQNIPPLNPSPLDGMGGSAIIYNPIWINYDFVFKINTIVNLRNRCKMCNYSIIPPTNLPIHSPNAPH